MDNAVSNDEYEQKGCENCLSTIRSRKMTKKMAMAVIAAVFLNVCGAYADRMFALGGTMFFHGNGGIGLNGTLPQVGYISAEKDIDERRVIKWDSVYGEYPVYYTRPLGWKFNDFDYSILFDLTAGFGFAPDVLNVSAGLTAEFYFLPAFLKHWRIGAGIGGGWGLIGWNKLLLEKDTQNPYGAPYARVTIPILLGMFKTGVYFDYYFMDEPYTQFNIVFALML
jgi:hypothetical protein